jgi:uncharacterized membrane protein
VSTGRLEAFSDGVLAIVITIMVLELRAPHGADWAALQPLLPKFLSFVLSFIYLAIYWNNHHHLLKLSGTVNGAILWANMHLLFWLSLVPFSTAWMGENHFAWLPVAVYGVTLLMPAFAWKVLQAAIVRHQGPGSLLAAALGNDAKGWLSLGLYLVGILAAFFTPMLAMLLYSLVTAMWLVPDQRFERRIAGTTGHGS